MNKLHAGEIVTSHGIITAPKKVNIKSSYEENKLTKLVSLSILVIFVIILGASGYIVLATDVMQMLGGR